MDEATGRSLQQSGSTSEVPAGWRDVALGSLGQVVMGQSPPGSTVLDWDGGPQEGGGLPFIQGNAEFGAKSPVPVKWCSQPLKVAQAGDALISVRAPVGATNRADRPLAIGRGLASIQFLCADPSFGWHALNRAKGAFGRVAQGSTFEAISSKEVLGLAILLPPLPEQRAIARVLDAIDEAIERTEAVIAATETLRKALLQELLTRGVPGWHAEWKQVPGLGTIPAGWKVARLGDVAAIERGRFGHRPRNEPRFYGGPYPFIQTGDVAAAKGRIRSWTQTLNDQGLSISRLFPAGTVVMTIAANIGETAVTEIPVAFPDSLVGIIPHSVKPEFLEYFLRTRRSELQSLAPRSAQQNINLETLKPLRVPLPREAEQEAAVQLLGSVEEFEADEAVVLGCLQGAKAVAADVLLTGRMRAGEPIPGNRKEVSP